MKAVRGFTLIELVTVLILVSILGAFVLPRFTDSDLSDVQASRDSLVAALFLARQLAMARDSSANPIQVVTTTTSITVREAGADVRFADLQYPLQLPAGLLLSPATTLDYNKLGSTSAAVFSLSKGNASASVVVNETGYAD